ncbi:MAG: hypothetical protein ACREMY_24215, partial [bacterium]
LKVLSLRELPHCRHDDAVTTRSSARSLRDNMQSGELVPRFLRDKLASSRRSVGGHLADAVGTPATRYD